MRAQPAQTVRSAQYGPRGGGVGVDLDLEGVQAVELQFPAQEGHQFGRQHLAVGPLVSGVLVDAVSVDAVFFTAAGVALAGTIPFVWYAFSHRAHSS